MSVHYPRIAHYALTSVASTKNSVCIYLFLWRAWEDQPDLIILMLFLTCCPGHASVVDGEDVVEGGGDCAGRSREAITDRGDDVNVARPQLVHRRGRHLRARTRTLGAREREASRHRYLFLILQNANKHVWLRLEIAIEIKSYKCGKRWIAWSTWKLSSIASHKWRLSEMSDN